MSHRCLILNFALNQQKKFLKLYLPIFFQILDIYFLLKIVSSLLFRYSIFKELFSIILTFEVRMMILPGRIRWVILVGTNGLEPSTSRLSGVRSNHLSYAPLWWRLRESNPWPPACKAGALPAELNPRIFFSKVFSEAPSKLNNNFLTNFPRLLKARD